MPPNPPAASKTIARHFAGIDVWIFDLDNTLYPSHSNLFEQVDRRITDYIARYLEVERDEAFRIQKEYYRQYGTSLRGLMVENGMDPHDFLAYVHDIDHSPLEPDPALGAVLAALPGRKFVLTNGSRGHAENVTRKLGIDHHFEDMFGIVEANFEPKPARQPFDNLIGRFDVSPNSAAMFEDIARNLIVPKELGMTTILVADTSPGGEEWRGDWEKGGTEEAHVDHVTDDLAGFLLDICDGLGIDMAHAELGTRRNGMTTG